MIHKAPTSSGFFVAEISTRDRPLLAGRRRARYRRNPKQLQIIKNNRLVWYYDKTLHGDALNAKL